MKKFLVIITLFTWLMPSCIKSRECQCSKPTTDSTRVFYINGNKTDSQKACSGMAEINETCKLKWSCNEIFTLHISIVFFIEFLH